MIINSAATTKVSLKTTFSKPRLVKLEADTFQDLTKPDSRD